MSAALSKVDRVGLEFGCMSATLSEADRVGLRFDCVSARLEFGSMNIKANHYEGDLTPAAGVLTQRWDNRTILAYYCHFKVDFKVDLRKNYIPRNHIERY